VPAIRKPVEGSSARHMGSLKPAGLQTPADKGDTCHFLKSGYRTWDTFGFLSRREGRVLCHREQSGPQAAVRSGCLPQGIFLVSA